MGITQNPYLIPLAGAFMLLLFGILRVKPRKTRITDTSLIYNGVDKPFDNALSNLLFKWSYKKPFSWFIPEIGTHPSITKRNRIIARAELTNKLDHRAFTVLQTSLLMGAMIISIIVFLSLRQGDWLFRLLFNISVSDGENLMTISTLVTVLLFLVALMPNMYISYVSGKNTDAFIRDLPLLQLFLILMIRSKRPIGEMFYTLSKSDGRYKNIFATGYRIFLRDRDAGFNYLESAFNKTSFKDSISVLATCEEYSREFSAESLQAKMGSLLEDVATLKKKKGVLRGLLSEGSIALPFVAVMALGVGPVLYGVAKSMSEAFIF